MKKSTLLLAFFLLAPIGAQAADMQDFFAAAEAYGQKQYQRCADILAELQREGITPPQGGDLLQAACLAGAGHIDEAIRNIETKLAHGKIDMDALRNKDTPGLNIIRQSPQWPALLAKAEQMDTERQARIDQPLREELLARIAKDQQLEQAVIDSGKASAEAWQELKLGPLMADNTAWLKQVVASKGWPSISMVGEDGASAAFLIVQHSDADPEFQAQVLPLMEVAVAKQEALPSLFAMLTDRVLRAQGKPQRYGTQFITNDDGSMTMQPTEDEAHLDERRLKMGLPPIADYRQMLSETYHQPVR
jgi:hypothetical protein